MHKQQVNLHSTKQHFEILDGLRGLAAVAVVIFHFMEIVTPDLKDNFIAHAYLAVDFFFCLSGFVIAYAYDSRFAGIGILKFIKLRLIRLHPLVIIGSVLGLLLFVYDPFSNLYEIYADKTFIMFITSCLMIPYPIVGERFFNLFHLNPPTWSLFFEYLANIFYALILVRLRNKFLWVLLVIAAALIIYEAQRSGNLVVGWSGDTFAGGAIRVFYSFLAGMLVYRSKWIINSNAGFISVSLLLLLAFIIPFSEKLNPITEPLIVIFYFPFIVALGAGARLSATLSGICKFSGKISYPLYMVHYPFIWLFLSYVIARKPSLELMTAITVAGVFLMIALAYIVMIYIDEPIRKWLGRSAKRIG